MASNTSIETSKALLSDDIGGILSHILEACSILCPHMVVGEVWTSSVLSSSINSPSSSSSSNEWNQLISFYAPTPLIANHTEKDGRPVTRNIDVRIAAAFASLHTVSLRIIEKTVKNHRIDWFYELGGDQLISLLKFSLQSVIAVPIMINQDSLKSIEGNHHHPSTTPVCCAIMLLYSGKREEQNGLVLNGLQNLAKLASRAIQMRLGNHHSDSNTPRISYRYQVPPPPPALSNDSTLTPEQIARNADTGEDEAIYQPWLTGTVGLLKVAASVLSADYVEVCIKQQPSNSSSSKSLVNNENNQNGSRDFISLFPHIVPKWKPRTDNDSSSDHHQHSHTTLSSSVSSTATSTAPVPPKDAIIHLAEPRTDNNHRTDNTKIKDSNGSPLYGAIGSAFLSAAIREASALTRSMCSDNSTVTSPNQPVTWLSPHEMVARSNNHWQAASVLHLTLPVGQALENEHSNTLALDFIPNKAKITYPVVYEIVAVFFWSEPGHLFGTPEATSFLSTLVTNARTCASSSSITASDNNSITIYKSNGSNRLPTPNNQLTREVSGEHKGGPLSPSSTGSGGFDGNIINSLVNFATAAIDRSESEANLQAPTKSATGPQGERVLSSTGNVLLGNAMRRPRSGLDLLAAYSAGDAPATGNAHDSVTHPTNSDVGISLHPPTDSNNSTILGKRGLDQDKTIRNSFLGTVNENVAVDTTNNGTATTTLDSTTNTDLTSNLSSASEDVKRARLPSVAASESGVEGAHDIIAMVNSINPTTDPIATPHMGPSTYTAYQNPYLYNPTQHTYDNNAYLPNHSYMNHPGMYGGTYNPYITNMNMGMPPQHGMMNHPNGYPNSYPMMDPNSNPLMNNLTDMMNNPNMNNHHMINNMNGNVYHPDGLSSTTLEMGTTENMMHMGSMMSEDSTAIGDNMNNNDGTNGEPKPKKRRGGARVKSATTPSSNATGTNGDSSVTDTPSGSATATTPGATNPTTGSPQEVSFVGLPVVSAAALARVKGRSRAPKPKLSVALRRGKWPVEEEDFTTAIVETFREGYLPLADGTTLRTYLSGQLHCAPMRITKKFAKDASIGKQVYKRRNDIDKAEWDRRSADARSRVLAARSRFHNSVMIRNRIDLRLIVPDPFPEGGIVKNIYGLDGDEGFDDDDDEGGEENENAEATIEGDIEPPVVQERSRGKRGSNILNGPKRATYRTSGNRRKGQRSDSDNPYGYQDDQYIDDGTGNYIDGIPSSSSFMMDEHNGLPTSFTEMLDGPNTASTNPTGSKSKKSRKSQNTNDLQIKINSNDYNDGTIGQTPLIDENSMMVSEDGSAMYNPNIHLNTGIPPPMMNNNMYHQSTYGNNMQAYGSMNNMMMNNIPNNTGYLPYYYMNDNYMGQHPNNNGNSSQHPNSATFMIPGSEANTPLPKYDDPNNNTTGIMLSSLPSTGNFTTMGNNPNIPPLPLGHLRNSMEDMANNSHSASVTSFTDDQLTAYNNNNGYPPAKRNRSNNSTKTMGSLPTFNNIIDNDDNTVKSNDTMSPVVTPVGGTSSKKNKQQNSQSSQQLV